MFTHPAESGLGVLNANRRRIVGLLLEQPVLDLNGDHASGCEIVALRGEGLGSASYPAAAVDEDDGRPFGSGAGIIRNADPKPQVAAVDGFVNERLADRIGGG